MIKEFVSSYMTAKGFQKPKAGNTESGDEYLLLEEEDYYLCVMVDGLGSGKGAKEAATAVIQTIRTYHTAPILEMMERCNEAVCDQRGAVVTVFKYFYKTKKVEYSSIGNIRLVFLFPDGSLIRPIPIPGYLSGRMQKFKLQTFQLISNVVFLLYSDGVQPSWFTKETVDMIKSYSVNMLDYFYCLTEQKVNRKDDVTLLIGKFY